MSAVPRKAGETHRHSLAEALMSSALVHERLAERDAQIRRAIDDSARQLVYRWQTADAREADIKVFYRFVEEVDVLAVELVRIDYRSPTKQERLHYENEFDAEILAAGELWQDVASFIER